MSDYYLKKILLYDQLVDVKVYPPKKTPDSGGLAVNPTGRTVGSSVDSTVYETPRIGGPKKRRKNGRSTED